MKKRMLKRRKNIRTKLGNEANFMFCVHSVLCRSSARAHRRELELQLFTALFLLFFDAVFGRAHQGVTEKETPGNYLRGEGSFVDGPGFEPGTSTMPTWRSCQADLPAHKFLSEENLW
jgi:hypothetical protein